MNVHIRFRKSFESYEQGQRYRLPDDIADIYLRAGVAEIVDHVPAVVAQVSEPEPEVSEPEPEEQGDDEPEPDAKPKRKRS